MQSHPLIFCITFCISIGLIFFPLNPQYTFRSVPHIWFYLGCWVKYKESSINLFYQKYRLMIICVFLLSLTLPFWLEQGRTNNVITQYISSILFVLLIYNSVSSNQISKYTELLDKNSFAIYLFHIPIIYLIIFYNHNINPYIISSLCVIISYIISIALGSLIRKSKLKILIGE